MSVTIESVGEDRAREVVLDALKKSDGRVTVGDVVASSGLGRDDAELGLKSLLSTHEGHLEVGEGGELVYLFDPKLVRRDRRSSWDRFKQAGYAAFKMAFKVWIMVMLVGYFVIYVALAIAALVAMSRGDSGESRIGRRGGLRLHWLIYLFWTPDWRYGNRYYGDRRDTAITRREKKKRANVPKAPFYKKVFAFVFGPDVPEEDALERDRELAALIRSRRGVLTTAELIEVTGATYAEADSEMSRLMFTLGGDAEVSDGGEVVYVFPELMVSARGEVHAEPPPPAWDDLEPARVLTGNSKKSNGIIIFFNAFNLVFALIAPSAIFPILGMGGAAVMIGLVWIPLVFSALFFAVPSVRYLRLGPQNRARSRHNTRVLVLREVFGATRRGQPTVSADAVTDRVVTDLGKQGEQVAKPEATGALEELAIEFEAELQADPSGGQSYAFHAVARAYREGDAVRAAQRLEDQRVGEIVYSSADDGDGDGDGGDNLAAEIEALERDLAEQD